MSNSQNAPNTTAKQIPRDALVMHTMLKELGVASYDPKVIHQMLEYVYRYVTNVIEEARVYSNLAKKKMIDIEDIRLVVKTVAEKYAASVPPRDVLLDFAKVKNSTPLPLIKSGSGLRLPPDRFCLTQVNYQLNLYKRAIASSSSSPSTSSVRLQSTPVFKTPATPRMRPSGVTNQPVIHINTSGVNAGTPTIRVVAPSIPTPGPSPTITIPSQPSHGVKRKASDDLLDT